MPVQATFVAERAVGNSKSAPNIAPRTSSFLDCGATHLTKDSKIRSVADSESQPTRVHQEGDGPRHANQNDDGHDGTSNGTLKRMGHGNSLD